MERIFRKIKLENETTLLCEFTQTLTLDDGRHVEITDKKVITAQLHPDMLNAFKRLRIHFALISCQVPDNAVSKNMFNSLDAYEIKGISQFVCNQVILTGLGQDRGIQLAGRRIVKQNKVINWTTPMIRPSHEEDYYEHRIDLHNDVERVIEEADECLDGKYTEVKQMEIDSEEPIKMN